MRQGRAASWCGLMLWRLLRRAAAAAAIMPFLLYRARLQWLSPAQATQTNCDAEGLPPPPSQKHSFTRAVEVAFGGKAKAARNRHWHVHEEDMCMCMCTRRGRIWVSTQRVRWEWGGGMYGLGKALWSGRHAAQPRQIKPGEGSHQAGEGTVLARQNE